MQVLERSVKGGAKLFAHKGAWEYPDSAVRDTRSAEMVGVPYPRQPTIGFLPPPAIYAAARLPWWKTFWLGILAGVYLSLAGALAYTVGGTMPEVMQTNPGVQKLVFAAIGLPLGLGLIIICGAELYTTNAAWLPAAVYEGRANMLQLCKNWFFSYFGNLAGCLIVVWLLDETLLWDTDSEKMYPFLQVQNKTGDPWGAEVIRAMGANLLVCLAAWQAQASQDIISKIFAIFFPVLAFVSMSFSHVVANMFWVPFGIKLGSQVTVGRYIVHSMIPDWLGNTIVAAFFLAGSYGFCYGSLGDSTYRACMRLTGRQPQGSEDTKVNDSAHGGGAEEKQQQAHVRTGEGGSGV